MCHFIEYCYYFSYLLSGKINSLPLAGVDVRTGCVIGDRSLLTPNFRLFPNCLFIFLLINNFHRNFHSNIMINNLCNSVRTTTNFPLV